MNNPNQNEKAANTQKDASVQQQQGQSTPSDAKNTQQGGSEDKSRTEIKKDGEKTADQASKASK